MHTCKQEENRSKKIQPPNLYASIQGKSQVNPATKAARIRPQAPQCQGKERTDSRVKPFIDFEPSEEAKNHSHCVFLQLTKELKTQAMKP